MRAGSGPKPLERGEQEQRVGEASGRQDRRRPARPERVEADAETLGPGAVVAGEALRKSGTAGGEADVEQIRRAGRGGGRWLPGQDRVDRRAEMGGPVR